MPAMYRARRGFLREVLKSKPVAAECKAIAQDAAVAAGPGWRVVPGYTRDRARFAVIPGDLDAIYDASGGSASRARDNLRRALG